MLGDTSPILRHRAGLRQAAREEPPAIGLAAHHDDGALPGGLALTTGARGHGLNVPSEIHGEISIDE
jgi:hypothetical protein